MDTLIRYENGIYAFDAGYVRPLLAAIHLIVENGRAAIVDTGNNESLGAVERALAALDLAPECVDYVILTHIHLDHAGGAGAMMRAFPNARLVVHPRGARHMADPAKLVAGATAVYGAAEVRRLYGEVLPIDAGRIVEAAHELRLDLAGRELLCLDTPGHARHHICIVDCKSGGIFTGDTFGLSYRELDTDGRQFIFPTTTPVQFDPQAMHASLDLLMSYRPTAMYLTHYSQVVDVAAKAAELHRLIDAHLDIARREKDSGPDRHSRMRAMLAHLLVDEAKAFGCQLPPAEILEIFATDLELNAQGLGVWLDAQN
ncbi:MAG: MBL fold metallo-hydrolase [Candidatus Accumulibacter sp. 66-26]|nr:MBL fold metallo-hydrolase [Accumulibacter sp.]OJW51592.1 MAG: MBL fold metallo-hydrolase [Candidatus Accumulibacter sp. 66-26]